MNAKGLEFVYHGFRTIIGNRLNANFWSDDWLGWGFLKVFPRIFALAVEKQESMVNFQNWNQGVWQWDIALRRRPLNWETHIWEDFNFIIESVFLKKNSPDLVV